MVVPLVASSGSPLWSVNASTADTCTPESTNTLVATSLLHVQNGVKNVEVCKHVDEKL